MTSTNGKWVGIDLGTTNSLVAIWDVNHNTVELLTNMQGYRLTESMVSYTENELLIGKAAETNQCNNLENTAYGVKRLLGKCFDDPKVQSFRRDVPFKILDVENRPMIQVQYRDRLCEYAPWEISAAVLAYMKTTAEQRMSQRANDNIKVTNAVITVPAYFKQGQKAETLQAAKAAGFTGEIRLITEPGAAAIAYGQDKNMTNGYSLFVFDFGGGTFDTSIIQVENGVFTVKSIDGDTDLGGRDFDLKLMRHFAELMKRRYGRDPLADDYIKFKLLKQCETLKKQLSSMEKSWINVSEVYSDIREKLPMTREEFEDLCRPLMEQAMAITERTLKFVHMNPRNMDELLLVGGTTRIPMCVEMLKDLGFNASGRRQINNKSMDPDEAVGRGAGVLAALLARDPNVKLPELVLSEAIPLSLGTTYCGELFSTLIPRNSNVPVEVTKTFTTAANDQQSMNFKICEGERPLYSADGFCVLDNLPIQGLSKGIAGSVDVKLTMKLDKNGILTVVATHGDIRKECQINCYKAKSKTSKGVGEILNDAKQNFASDLLEESRRKMMTELELEIERSKYNCTNRDLLNLCQIFENWVKVNQKASQEILEEKRAEFDRKKVALL